MIKFPTKEGKIPT